MVTNSHSIACLDAAGVLDTIFTEIDEEHGKYTFRFYDVEGTEVVETDHD
jgi:hypothetical protein